MANTDELMPALTEEYSVKLQGVLPAVILSAAKNPRLEDDTTPTADSSLRSE